MIDKKVHYGLPRELADVAFNTFKKAAQGLGIEPLQLAFINNERATWARVVRDIGIQPD